MKAKLEHWFIVNYSNQNSCLHKLQKLAVRRFLFELKQSVINYSKNNLNTCTWKGFYKDVFMSEAIDAIFNIMFCLLLVACRI